MKRTSRNPTRRVGPRTGAIPVDEKVVQRILNKIFRSPQVKAVRGEPGMVTLQPRRERRTFGRRRRLSSWTTHSITIHDKIASYATGKIEPLTVEVLDKEREVPSEHQQSGGWASSTPTRSSKLLPKKKRVARLSRAIEALGKRVTPLRLDKLLDSYVAKRGWTTGRVANVSLVTSFGVPHHKERLRRRLGDILRHELAHSMDESVRQRQTRRDAAEPSDELHDDMHGVVGQLRLPRRLLKVWHDPTPPPPPKVRRPREPRVFDATYYNDPVEVTARIVEILHELNSSSRTKVSFQEELVFITPYFSDRSQKVLSAVRTASPTFVNLEPWLTPKNFARVMKAIYDRYSGEPWFPQATGVYKNRRTSRRRTSRP